jgi:3-oxoacyl-[acyl-carrier-protein] synthase II
MGGQRVVITGVGCISPLGLSVEATWHAILASQHGFRLVEEYQDFPAAVFAVAATHHPRELMPEVNSRFARRLTLPMIFFFAAVSQALRQSELEGRETEQRIGLIGGTTANYPVEVTPELLASYYRYFNGQEIDWERMLDAISYPQDHMWQHTTNFLTCFPAYHFGLTGINRTIHASCACGTHAVGEAYRLIQHGHADIILAGAAESLINFGGISALSRLGVLSPQRDCAIASRPFDAERDGLVLGEGAGVLVVESLKSAQERDAPILAEIAGFGATSNAYRVTDSPVDGESASRAISMCLQEAGVTPEQVGAISAHATSTKQNDLAETNAIKLALGKQATHIPTFALKSYLGHSLSASGAIELVLAIPTLQTGILPPILSYQYPDKDCDLNIVREITTTTDLTYILKNSFGFGGQNGSILLKKWNGAQAGSDPQGVTHV